MKEYEQNPIPGLLDGEGKSEDGSDPTQKEAPITPTEEAPVEESLPKTKTRRKKTDTFIPFPKEGRDPENRNYPYEGYGRPRRK